MAWRERWAGLRGWFLRSEAGPSQTQTQRLRARAPAQRRRAAQGARPLGRKSLAGRKIAAEDAQLVAARQRLITEQITRLSEVSRLDRHAFNLFLDVLGEALAAMRDPRGRIERLTSDGSLALTLEPIDDAAIVTMETESGVFAGRDHWIHVREVE